VVNAVGAGSLLAGALGGDSERPTEGGPEESKLSKGLNLEMLGERERSELSERLS
jgi:hypothetical protein